MAEAGLIASVVGISSVGVKLSITLYTFAETVKSADKTIKDIANDVSLTSSVLEELGVNLKKDSHTKTYSDQGLKTAQKVVLECSRVFDDIDGALGKSMSKVTEGSLGKDQYKKFTLSALEKLKWPFMEPKMKLLRSNLDRLKSTLILLLNVLTYARKLKQEEPKASTRSYDRDLIETMVRSNQEATQKYEELRKALLLPAEKPSEAAQLKHQRCDGSEPSHDCLTAAEEQGVKSVDSSLLLCMPSVPPRESFSETLPDIESFELRGPMLEPHGSKIGSSSDGLSADELSAFVDQINGLVKRLEEAHITIGKQETLGRAISNHTPSPHVSAQGTDIPHAQESGILLSPVYKFEGLKKGLSSTYSTSTSGSSSMVSINSRKRDYPADKSHSEEPISGDLSTRKSPQLKSATRKRTGCKTCSFRHIKCGEERPACNNCIRSKRSCGGYTQRVIFKDALASYGPNIKPMVNRESTSRPEDPARPLPRSATRVSFVDIGGVSNDNESRPSSRDTMSFSIGSWDGTSPPSPESVGAFSSQAPTAVNSGSQVPVMLRTSSRGATTSQPQTPGVSTDGLTAGNSETAHRHSDPSSIKPFRRSEDTSSSAENSPMAAWSPSFGSSDGGVPNLARTKFNSYYGSLHSQKSSNPASDNSPQSSLIETTTLSYQDEALAQSAVMAGPGVGPPRRSHTNSRKGCKTCKRRHIRCDENFPQCRNCTKHSCKCDYIDPAHLLSPSCVPPGLGLWTPSTIPSTQAIEPAYTWPRSPDNHPLTDYRIKGDNLDKYRDSDQTVDQLLSQWTTVEDEPLGLGWDSLGLRTESKRLWTTLPSKT